MSESVLDHWLTDSLRNGWSTLRVPFSVVLAVAARIGRSTHADEHGAPAGGPQFFGVERSETSKNSRISRRQQRAYAGFDITDSHHRLTPRPLYAHGGTLAPSRGDAADQVVRRRDGPTLGDVEQVAVDDLDSPAEAPRTRNEARPEVGRRGQLKNRHVGISARRRTRPAVGWCRSGPRGVRGAGAVRDEPACVVTAE